MATGTGTGTDSFQPDKDSFQPDSFQPTPMPAPNPMGIANQALNRIRPGLQVSGREMDPQTLVRKTPMNYVTAGGINGPLSAGALAAGVDAADALVPKQQHGYQDLFTNPARDIALPLAKGAITMPKAAGEHIASSINAYRNDQPMTAWQEGLEGAGDTAQAITIARGAARPIEAGATAAREGIPPAAPLARKVVNSDAFNTVMNAPTIRQGVLRSLKDQILSYGKEAEAPEPATMQYGKNKGKPVAVGSASGDTTSPVVAGPRPSPKPIVPTGAADVNSSSPARIPPTPRSQPPDTYVPPPASALKRPAYYGMKGRPETKPGGEIGPPEPKLVKQEATAAKASADTGGGAAPPVSTVKSTGTPKLTKTPKAKVLPMMETEANAAEEHSGYKGQRDLEEGKTITSSKVNTKDFQQVKPKLVKKSPSPPGPGAATASSPEFTGQSYGPFRPNTPTPNTGREIADEYAADKQWLENYHPEVQYAQHAARHVGAGSRTFPEPPTFEPTPNDLRPIGYPPHPRELPPTHFHVTPTNNVESIMREGLDPSKSTSVEDEAHDYPRARNNAFVYMTQSRPLTQFNNVWEGTTPKNLTALGVHAPEWLSRQFNNRRGEFTRSPVTIPPEYIGKYDPNSQYAEPPKLVRKSTKLQKKGK